MVNQYLCLIFTNPILAMNFYSKPMCIIKKTFQWCTSVDGLGQ